MLVQVVTMAALNTLRNLNKSHLLLYNLNFVEL